MHDDHVFGQRRSLVAGGLLAGVAAMATRDSLASTTPPPVIESGIPGVVFNVKDYGATGAGSIDDTLAIQSAINAALAVNGGIILFPAGAYLVGGTLSITSSLTPTITGRLTLQGVGPSASILVIPATAPDTLVVNGTSLAIDGFCLRELGFVSTSNRTSGRTIALLSTTNCLIEHVTMDKQWIGCEIIGGTTHRIRSSLWNIAPNGIGFLLNGTSLTADTYLDNLYVTGGFAGFEIKETGCIIMNCCENVGSTHGLLISPGSGQVVEFCLFQGCIWDSATSDSILISPTGTGAVRDLTFTNCWSSSSATGNCCAITGNVDGVGFVGHSFLNAPVGNGLWVSGATNVFADACVASAMPQGTGFCFVNNAKRFAVRNCYSGTYNIFVPNKVGIQVTAGCSDYMLVNNILKSNTTSNLIDSGGAVSKVVSSNLSLP